MKYKTDLLLMGYRPLGTNEHGVTVYAKPFGYTLLVISIKGDRVTLTQHYSSKDNRPLVWKDMEYDPSGCETLAECIRLFESFEARTGIGYGSPGSDEYAFLTWEQQLEVLVK